MKIEKLLLFFLVFILSIHITVAATGTLTNLLDTIGSMGGSGTQFWDTYVKYAYFIDGILYMVLFTALSKKFIGEKFGNGVAITIGIILGVAMIGFSAMSKFYLGKLAWYAALIFFTLFGVMTYNFIKSFIPDRAFLAACISILVVNVLITLLSPLLLETMKASPIAYGAYISLSMIALIGVPIAVFGAMKGKIKLSNSEMSDAKTFDPQGSQTIATTSKVDDALEGSTTDPGERDLAEGDKTIGQMENAQDAMSGEAKTTAAAIGAEATTETQATDREKKDIDTMTQAAGDIETVAKTPIQTPEQEAAVKQRIIQDITLETKLVQDLAKVQVITISSQGRLIEVIKSNGTKSTDVIKRYSAMVNELKKIETHASKDLGAVIIAKMEAKIKEKENALKKTLSDSPDEIAAKKLARDAKTPEEKNYISAQIAEARKRREQQQQIIKQEIVALTQQLEMIKPVKEILKTYGTQLVGKIDLVKKHAEEIVAQTKATDDYVVASAEHLRIATTREKAISPIVDQMNGIIAEMSSPTKPIEQSIMDLSGKTSLIFTHTTARHAQMKGFVNTKTIPYLQQLKITLAKIIQSDMDLQDIHKSIKELHKGYKNLLEAAQKAGAIPSGKSELIQFMTVAEQSQEAEMRLDDARKNAITEVSKQIDQIITLLQQHNTKLEVHLNDIHTTSERTLQALTNAIMALAKHQQQTVQATQTALSGATQNAAAATQTLSTNNKAT